MFILFIPFDVFCHAWVYPCFRFVLNPFSDEYFTSFSVEIRPLTFLHVIDPMTFVMVPIPSCKYPLPRLLAVLPLAFVDIPTRVNHPTFPVRDIFKPVAVLSGSVFHPQSAFAWTHIFFILAYVFFEHLVIVLAVLGAKAVFLIIPEVAFLSVSIWECKYPIPIFFVTLPISSVFVIDEIFSSFDIAFFVWAWLFDEEDTFELTSFISFWIIYFP